MTTLLDLGPYLIEEANEAEKRPKQKPNKSTEKSYAYCDVCNTSLTKAYFYNVHKGTKKHRRNLRKAEKNEVASPLLKIVPKGRSAQFIHPVSSIPPVDDTFSSTQREKYKPREAKNPSTYSKSYISALTALWMVRLAFDISINNFKISLNDKSWGDYGDAVLEIEQTDEYNTAFRMIFAIQFKDICSNAKQIDALHEGRYSLTKFITQMNSIRIDNIPDYTKFVTFSTATASDSLNRHIPLDSIVLHGLRKMTKTKEVNTNEKKCSCKGNVIHVTAKNVKAAKELLINTSGSTDNIYMFTSTDQHHTIPRMFLYTHQPKQKNFNEEIEEKVTEMFDLESKPNIYRELYRYIEHWSEGILGGNYKLTKEDVLIKLGHFVLDKYQIPPMVRQSDTTRDYTIWRHAVSSVDVTVLHQHPGILSKICDPINLSIESQLGISIDIPSRSIDLSSSIVNELTNHRLKCYIFEETLGDLKAIRLECVYKFFWKSGLVPLLLSVDDSKVQEQIFDIISTLKTLGLSRRYILLTPRDQFKDSLRYFNKSLTYFLTADNIIEDLLPDMLETVKIRVDENFSLNFKSLLECDEFIFKDLTAVEFLDISLGRYSLRPVDRMRNEEKHHPIILKLKDNEIDYLKQNHNTKIDGSRNSSYMYLQDIPPDVFATN